MGRFQEQSEGVGRMKWVRRESQHKGSSSSQSHLWTTGAQSCWNLPRSHVEHASRTVHPRDNSSLGWLREWEHLFTSSCPPLVKGCPLVYYNSLACPCCTCMSTRQVLLGEPCSKSFPLTLVSIRDAPWQKGTTPQSS